MRRRHPTYVIERVIYEPVPEDDLLPAVKRSGAAAKFPLARMKPGHSFLVEDPGAAHSVRTRACLFGQETGRVFRTTKVANGCRVERVS